MIHLVSTLSAVLALAMVLAGCGAAPEEGAPSGVVGSSYENDNLGAVEVAVANDSSNQVGCYTKTVKNNAVQTVCSKPTLRKTFPKYFRARGRCEKKSGDGRYVRVDMVYGPWRARGLTKLTTLSSKTSACPSGFTLVSQGVEKSDKKPSHQLR